MKTPSFGIYANQTDKRWNTFIEEMNAQITGEFKHTNNTHDTHIGILSGDAIQGSLEYFRLLSVPIITLDDYFADGSVYRVVKSNCLMDNKKWYADNGTVYNHEDDFARIVLVTNEHGSYTNLPKDVAESIASMLNSKEQPFKRGERILVWSLDYNYAQEVIALTYVEGVVYPVIAVQNGWESEFLNGTSPVNTSTYKFWKPIPTERQKLQQEIEQLEKELNVKREKLKEI